MCMWVYICRCGYTYVDVGLHYLCKWGYKVYVDVGINMWMWYVWVYVEMYKFVYEI